jgi:hypothetical protein
MNSIYTVEDCKILALKKISDVRGNLTVIEGLRDVPFEIKRVYYTYDVPSGEYRGEHAHKTLKQLIIAVSGSFDVHLDDGASKRVVTLNRPYLGLYIVEMIWRYIDNYSSGAVSLVLASDFYFESDYIRNYDDFLTLKGVVKRE